MADELLVAGIVRAYAERRLLGGAPVSEQAVTAAVQAHLCGASASEACRRGQQLVDSHERHPSCGHRAPTRRAS
jgi:hypothetical protein